MTVMAGRSGQMSQCSGFQPLVYIVCVLDSRLLYWVQMFSGLGILVAPRLSTFRVNLGGISSFGFFIPREEVLFIIVLPLWFHQCCNVYSQYPCLQDDASKHATAVEPYPRGSCGSSRTGDNCDHAVAAG